jgi:transcriptional regulator with XRE-family HTH domain
VTTRLDALLRSSSTPDWEIAVACKMHPSTLSRYRSGSREIIQRHAVKLADYFGVKIADVRGEVDSEDQ